MSNYSNGDYATPHGIIHMRNPGPKADPPYANVVTYHQTETRFVTLQKPAIEAFKAAELRITPRWMKRRGKVKHILVTGHGYRSWTYQNSLYSQEPGRFANPDGSNHVEALAVDLDTAASTFDKAKKALIAEGFKFTVDGEPWHGAFGVTG